MNGQLAQRLHGLRRANGLSQEELARKLAVSRQAVSKWECGDALPSTENLFALAELYGVGMATLMDDVRNDAREEDRRAGYDVEPGPLAAKPERQPTPTCQAATPRPLRTKNHPADGSRSLAWPCLASQLPHSSSAALPQNPTCTSLREPWWRATGPVTTSS